MSDDPAPPSPEADAPLPPAPPPVPAAIAGSAAYGLGKVSASDDKLMCVLCHALPIVTTLVAPLIIWLVKKDESPAVDAHGKETLNFHISILIYVAVGVIAMFASCGFLFFLPLVVGVFGLVMSIIGSVKAGNGELLRYPLTIRLIK